MIEGFSGEEGSLRWKIFNIKISDLELDFNPNGKNLEGSNDVQLTLNLPVFTVTADWWARYKSWLFSVTRDGGLTATANKISITVVASIDPLKVQDCRADVDLSVDVHGGGIVTKMLLLFKKRSFINDFEEDIEDSICDGIYRL